LLFCYHRAVSWPKWTVGGIRSLQERRIRAYLPEVNRFSPFYRKLWSASGVDIDKIRTVADMARLPFTTKADIVATDDQPAKYKDIILQPTPESLKKCLSLPQKLGLGIGAVFGRDPKQVMFDRYFPIHIISTTGRSARSVPFLYTYSDVNILKLSGKRIFDIIGLDPASDIGVHAFPFAPHLAFWQVAFAGFEARLRMLHTGGGRVMGSGPIADTLERMEATILVCTPGFAYHLAQICAEQGKRLPRLRLCILGAEKVNDAYKAKLKEIWAQCGAENVRVLSTYGLTEAKHAWVECTDAPNARYHLYPDLELFEVINPETGEQVKEGERGELVLTTLAGAGSVVVRYRTGDIAEGGIIIDKCPHCGRVTPLLDSRIGRVSEIKKVKGLLVNFNELFGWFSARKEIVEWQLEIGKKNDDEFAMDELRLRVALAEGTNRDSFERALNEDARRDFEMKFDSIEYLSREELSRLLGMDTLPKEARIIDKRS